MGEVEVPDNQVPDNSPSYCKENSGEVKQRDLDLETHWLVAEWRKKLFGWVVREKKVGVVHLFLCETAWVRRHRLGTDRIAYRACRNHPQGRSEGGGLMTVGRTTKKVRCRHHPPPRGISVCHQYRSRLWVGFESGFCRGILG